MAPEAVQDEFHSQDWGPGQIIGVEPEAAPGAVVAIILRHLEKVPQKYNGARASPALAPLLLRTRLVATGVAGATLGRGLYTGDLNLAVAIAVATASG